MSVYTPKLNRPRFITSQGPIPAADYSRSHRRNIRALGGLAILPLGIARSSPAVSDSSLFSGAVPSRMPNLPLGRIDESGQCCSSPNDDQKETHQLVSSLLPRTDRSKMRHFEDDERPSWLGTQLEINNSIAGKLYEQIAVTHSPRAPYRLREPKRISSATSKPSSCFVSEPRDLRIPPTRPFAVVQKNERRTCLGSSFTAS